jgi:RNA polymerase sigma-32 factor
MSIYGYAASKPIKEEFTMSNSLPSLACASKSGDFFAADVTHALIAKYQATGCAASLNKLLLNYSNMCMKIAQGYRHRFDVEDTYQDSMECLILSVRNFKPELGVPFFTYAYLDVKRRVSVRMIKQWSCVTTPVTKRFFKAFRRMPEFLKNTRFCDESATQLAEQIGVKREDVMAAYEIYRNMNYSLESCMDNGVRVIDAMSTEAGPENLVMEADLAGKRESMARVRMGMLNSKEAMIIKMRRMGEVPQTLHQIGALLGVSAERVRQIESKAMAKLSLAA